MRPPMPEPMIPADVQTAFERLRERFEGTGYAGDPIADLALVHAHVAARAQAPAPAADAVERADLLLAAAQDGARAVEERDELARKLAWVAEKRPCVYCLAGLGKAHADGCWLLPAPEAGSR